MMVDDSFRVVPTNELDLQLMMTDPVWGKDVPEGLKEKLKEVAKKKGVYVKDGKVYYGEFVSEEDLWSLLAMYTRDLRLGNLSFQELQYCQHWIDFARDCLAEGYHKAFLAGMSRAVTVIELSQSKRGFLRKLFGTVRTIQHQYSESADHKRGLFGQRKRREDEL